MPKGNPLHREIQRDEIQLQAANVGLHQLLKDRKDTCGHNGLKRDICCLFHSLLSKDISVFSACSAIINMV